MPTSTREKTPRRRRPYAARFRKFDPQRQALELAELRKLYEDDKLSVRQIARRKESSYGFIHARLTEAGANLAANSTSYLAPTKKDKR
jgi:hypothetical protein